MESDTAVLNAAATRFLILPGDAVSSVPIAAPMMTTNSDSWRRTKWPRHRDRRQRPETWQRRFRPSLLHRPRAGRGVGRGRRRMYPRNGRCGPCRGGGGRAGGVRVAGERTWRRRPSLTGPGAREASTPRLAGRRDRPPADPPSRWRRAEWAWSTSRTIGLDRNVAIKLIRPGAAATFLEGGARLLHEGPGDGAAVRLPQRVRHARCRQRRRSRVPRKWSTCAARPLAMTTMRRAVWRTISTRSSPPGAGSPRRTTSASITATSSPVTSCSCATTAASRSPTSASRGARRGRAGQGRPPSHGLLGVSVTVTGDLVGTVYMAPEQHRREPTDARRTSSASPSALFEALCSLHPFGDAKSSQFCSASSATNSRAVPAPAGADAPRAAARTRASPDRRFPKLVELLAELDARPRWVHRHPHVELTSMSVALRRSRPARGVA